ncbi:MAG: DUF1801 domain-containing protein [Firmicutes bacterium]|nr:DUF1801 domain-containing protein [Bacillota bacterium]
MTSNKAGLASIDEYIKQFPIEIQERLQKVRAAIRSVAPDASEAISYQMPTFKLNGNLVHFAAFKKHIGFFPTASGVAAFEDELQGYVHSKGAIQFPFDEPIPYSLIKKITKYRVKENTK